MLTILFTNNVLAYNLVNNSLLPVENFVEREDLIDKVKSKLNKGSRYLYIAGEAGIGKTQLVRRYVELHKKKYNVIWWINYSNDIIFQVNRLKKELQVKVCNNQCFIDVKENDMFGGIRNFVQNKNLKVLLIVDNLPNSNEAIYIKKVISDIRNTEIIFISRKGNNKKSDITVTGFSNSKALKYLKKLMVFRNNQREFANVIIKDARGSPLVLERLSCLFNSMVNLKVDSYNQMKNKNQIKELLDTSESMISEDTQYDRNIYAIYKDSFYQIKKENKDAYYLIKYISYLSDTIDEETLYKIWQLSKGDDAQAKYYKAVAYLVKSFVLKANKDNLEKDDSVIYEIHPLLREVFYEEVSLKGNNKENIKYLLRVFIQYLPEEFTKLSEYTAKNQIAFINLEKLINESNKHNLIVKELIQLKIKLLRIYIDNFLYDRAEKLIDNLYSVINKVALINDKKGAEHLTMFYLLNGRLWNYRYANYQKGIDSLKKSEEITNNNRFEIDQSIKFLVLCHLTDAMYHSGRIKEAEMYLAKLESELAGYLIQNKNVEYYNMIRAKLLLNNEKYIKALEETEKGMQIKVTRLGKQKTLLLPYIILKSEILINLERYLEARNYLDDYYKSCFQSKKNNNTLLQSRVLRLRALARFKLGSIKVAEEDIDKSIKLLKKNDEDNISETTPYLADAYVVNGDIFFKKLQYKKALEAYQRAEDIYLAKYNNVIESNKLSILFEKIMCAALKLQDSILADKYLNMHLDHFGQDNKRTKKMMKIILKRD